MRPQFRTASCLIIFVIVTIAIPHQLEAQAARVVITVVDEQGKPIAGVKVTVSNPEIDSSEVIKVTNKKGKITSTHIDSQPTYSYQLEKQGYQTLTTQIRPDYQSTKRLKLVLRSQKPSAVPLQGAPSGKSRALTSFQEGTEAYEKGDLDLAEKKFRLSAEYDSTLAEPHIALAVVAHQRGNYAVAVVEAEQALAINPSNEQALGLRYDSYRMLGNAGKTAEAAAALRQTEGGSIAAVRVFNEALKEHDDGDTASAKAKFQQALELDPQMVNAYIMLGSISLSEGKLAEAEAMASKILAIESTNNNALRIRYDALRRLGDAEGARQALEALIEADPEWVSNELFNHAADLYNNDEMADAAVALKKVIEARPDDAPALFLLGMAEYNLGDFENAKQHLGMFVELAPDHADAALAREILAYAPE